MRRFVSTSAVCSFFLAFFFASTTLALASTTIHVPADQPTIQAGINAAVNGDTVLVAPGTYYENVNFNGKAITVTSSGGPGVTVIDGSKTYAPTVSFATKEPPSAVLSGFTVQSGSAQISIENASPTIKSNIVVPGSSPVTAGGIYVNDGAPLISGNFVGGSGTAGIYSSIDTGIRIVGNVVAGNQYGLNIQYSDGAAVIQQNSIVGNNGTGLLYFPSNSPGAAIVQNLIYQNAGYGADLESPFTLVSNTIANNSVGGNGYELFSNFYTGMTVENNLLVAASQSPAVYCQTYSGSPVFANNDVFSADGASYSGYCLDQTGLSGNISVDPLFADLLSDNYHLQSSSPVIAAGYRSAPDEPKQDMDGDPRYTSGAIDIGADEYSANTSQTVSSYALHFGAQDVGSTSAPQVVSFTNNAKAPITVNLIATGPDFPQTNNCGATLAAGASCQISVTFSPLVGTTINSALGIFTSATSNPETVFLVGEGVAAQMNFCCGFNFYGTVIGTPNTQTGTLSNVGLIPLLINSITYAGPSDFGETNNCPMAPNTLPAGSSCTLTVTYTPTIIGSENGTITVSGNAGAPLTVYLTGSSVSAGNPVLSPTSLTFPTTLIGQSSAPQTLTLANSGSGPLGITSISTYSDFQQTNNCPASLAVNASCTLTITYVPSIQGTVSGFLQVTTDSVTLFADAQLTGTGSAPAPTVSLLSVASAPTGSTDTQVTITGTGFIYGSQVLWDGFALTNCCQSLNGNTQITFTIPAANLATVGTHQISVFTPTPGGGTSNSLPFTVYAPINYAEKSTTYNYRSITGTNLNLGFFGSAQIASPFPIQFGGGSYTNLTVGAGGTLSFNGFYSEYNDVIPTTQAPMLIAPFWAQLYPFGSGTDNNVFWEVTGTAPSRQLVVEWRDVGICCETTNTIRFEVVFSEGNSNILFNYANTIFGGSYSGNDNGATATSGVQVAPNLGTQFSYDQPLILSKTALLWYPSNPTATLSTSSVGFGYHQIDTPTLPQPITLTNGGLVALTISSIAVDNPDFTQTNNCGASVAPHQSCSIHLVFKPSQPTAETATLTITDNASNSPQTVALTGIGSITPVVVYPILVNFGSVAVGKTGTAPVTLANASNQTMTIQKITAAPGVYTESNNCGSSLAPGLSCTVTVTFKPSQKGSIQGTLSMGLNGKPVKVVSNLTGSGS